MERALWLIISICLKQNNRLNRREVLVLGLHNAIDIGNEHSVMLSYVTAGFVTLFSLLTNPYLSLSPPV